MAQPIYPQQNMYGNRLSLGSLVKPVTNVITGGSNNNNNGGGGGMDFSGYAGDFFSGVGDALSGGLEDAFAWGVDQTTDSLGPFKPMVGSFAGNHLDFIPGISKPTVGVPPSAPPPGVPSASGFNWDSSIFHDLPEYDSLLNEDGTLKDEYVLTSDYDPTYLNDLANFARSTDPSAWLQLTQDKINLEGAQARDDITEQRLGQLMQARENLAMRGGLRGGAAERLEGMGMEQAMMENQRLARSIQDQLLDASIAEETAKIDLRSQLPGMELRRAGFDAEVNRYNINNAFEEARLAYQFELDRLNKLNEILATQQTAEAQYANA